MQRRYASSLFLSLLLPCAGIGGPAKSFAKPAQARASVVEPCRGREFEAVVTAGRSFRTSIGGGMDFFLEAVSHGWVVRVVPSSGTRPEPDFAEVATPPFRSINPLLLTTDFGFRAQDVVGWNPRSFRFLRSSSDFAEAQRAYRMTTSAAAPTSEQEAAVTRVVLGSLEGRLEVLDAVLSPGTADQSASAGLLASHFMSTAHTLRAPEGKPAGPLGEILSLRIRVQLSAPRGPACGASTNAVRRP